MQIKSGIVLKVFYFLIMGKYRRMFSFIGLCVSKKKKTFTLQNFYGNEFVYFNFPISSPNILHIEKLSQYNFSFRLSKLYYFKKLRLKSSSLKFSKARDVPNPVFFLYKSNFISTKAKKKLRFKFRL